MDNRRTSVHLDSDISLWIGRQPRSFNFSELVNRLVREEIPILEANAVKRRQFERRTHGLIKVKDANGDYYYK